MSSSSPPEDPEYTSAPTILSPVSPKPIHFPIPDNIPVLHKQTDLAFNQMAAHIGENEQNGSTVIGEPSAEPVAYQKGSTTSVQLNGQNEGITDNIPQEANVSSEPHAEDQSHLPTSLANPPDHSMDATTESAALNIPPSASIVPHPQHASVSEVQTPLHAQVAQANTDALTTPQENPPDYSAILNSLKSSTSTVHAQDPAPSFIPLEDPSTSQSQPISAEYNAASAGLPPRPPPQAQPAINQNFSQASDIRQYHPHGSSNSTQAPPKPSYQTGANGLPPPPVPSFQQPQQSQSANPVMSPTQGHFDGPHSQARARRNSQSEIIFDGEPKWDPETQKEFDSFLEQERQYVTAGNWESFPMGSRLFVGNLSSERVTKRDVFHVFHRYGKLAQISIKQAYGFVQYLNAEDCLRALQGEQGAVIRGKRINLEVSKPQRNKPGVVSNNNNAGRRRSRSPDRTGVDRYVSGARQGDNRARQRDDYRPGRNQSPPRGRRDSYGRYRSRSRSPPGRGGRFRSPSPRRNEDDDLPLPRRAPRDVPDVQIIVVDPIDQPWIQWLERTISSRGVKVDVLMLSPRLSEPAVIKRQIIEGVTAVSRVNRFSRQTNKIPLQVFDRRGGTDVRFEEYADLDPQIAAEVVNRAKANNAPAPAPSYGYGYNSSAAPTPAQPAFATAGLPPNIGNAIGSMDAAQLQKLLGAMAPGQSQQPQMPPDLAKLLGGAVPGAQGGQGQYGQSPQQHQQNQDPLAALRGNPAFAGLLGQGVQQAQQQQQPQQQQNQGQGGAPNMADILAKLGTYKR
ncbi:hypothetical protein BDZ85DRAFT_285654 [Elsinoe ampelina]|uniref:RRM domain-containing protein n=1 Tax=Elsinoe ampelina TaxID=302913 RepID=A0A6A6G0K5_9PEZI|nr:hypothetical protein BDZ85DRAFT_285654 [Elsinoe ampelina]